MNKRSEINNLIDTCKPHVLALTEFGASTAVTDGELGVEGYSLYRGNHSDGKGGPGRGAALYISDSLNHSACPLFDDAGFDCSAWSMVKVSDYKTLLIGVVYRSPNSPDQNNENLLSMLKIASKANCSQLLVCGDFNLPHIDWNLRSSLEAEASFSSRFVEEIEEMSWSQHVTDSTRFRSEQNSCLDLVFTSEEGMVNEVVELPPIGKSDHVCQQWKVVVGEIIFKNTQVTRHNFKRANWAGMKNDFRSFEFEAADSPSKMNDELVEFIDKLKTKYVPLCRPKSKQHRLPWMRNAGLKAQRREKWRWWRRFKNSGMPRDYDRYKLERNCLKDKIRSAKMKYERGLIQDMKRNPNLFHGHCRRSLKTKQGVSNVIDGSGNLTKTEEEAAVALNIYYHSVFTRDDGETEPPVFPSQTEEKLTEVTFMTETIEDLLSSRDPNKAAGPDGVESKILKECSKELAPLLGELFQQSMDTGEVPDRWKEANIIPIHKSGSRAVMSNFRPVALTSVVSKVCEKIICISIMAFLTRNGLISQQQHGFVSGRSCQTNILLCLEKWTEMVDNGNSVDVAYFDYAKAFDKVSHRLLILKLSCYGIDGKLLKWLSNYLDDRKQRVLVGNAKSPWLEVVSGTTQGTVLGFLLFLLYINDLPAKCSPEDESRIMLLADDTKSYEEIGKDVSQQQEGQQKLQQRIDHIAQWAKDWRMEIHPAKSKILHVGKNNPGMTYWLNGTEISAVPVEKDIGFWVTDDLSSSTHIQKAKCKAMAEISRIRRNFSFIDKHAFCVLYNQRIRPHLDYGMAACPPGTSAEAKAMEGIQSKATSLVHGLRGKNSEERRLSLGLMTLQQRRDRGDLIEVYKILNGHTRIDPAAFWEVRPARNGARLVKELATNGRRQRQKFFSYRVVQKWNLLPADIKMAPSLNSFKNRVDERIMSN